MKWMDAAFFVIMFGFAGCTAYALVMLILWNAR